MGNSYFSSAFANISSLVCSSVFCIFAATSAVSAQSGSDYCKSLLRQAGSDLRARVTVEVIPGDPKYDFTLSQGELTSRSAGLIDIHENSFVNGLTDAYLEDRSRYMVEKVSTPSGGTCVWPSQYDMGLRYSNMVVYVASEFQEGSCPYAVTMRHELEHVRINNETLLANQYKLRDQMKSFIDRTFPIHVSGAQDADKIAGDLLRRASSKYMGEITSQRDHLHNELDSPESYAYWQSLCFDWSGKR